MPTCLQCGENEFDCIDGLFYCSLCQTQSQDVRVEETEYGEGTESHAVVHTLKGDKSATGKKVEEPGRLWMTHEGFQYILLEQVNALVKLGARENIKDVVWRLWMMYLSKVGVAFTKTNQAVENPRAFRCYPRHRDLNPGSMDNPKVKPLRFRTSMQIKFGGPIVSRKKSQKQWEKEQLSSSLGTEEFYKGDNPAEDSESSVDEDELLWNPHDIPGWQEGCQPAPGQKNARCVNCAVRNFYNDVARVNLMTTLGLCYLGLLYTGSLCGPGDLIRWVKQGKLPFYSASSALPESMKFYSYDTSTFATQIVPSTGKLRQVAGNLAALLKIKDSLPVPNMKTLIHKHLLTLQLPGLIYTAPTELLELMSYDHVTVGDVTVGVSSTGITPESYLSAWQGSFDGADMHGITTKLLQHIPLTLTHNSQEGTKPTLKAEPIASYDTVAMGYIIVTLKLLLGLDDSTERKLSTYARKMMKMVSLNQPLFVWEDWFQHMERSRAESRDTFVLDDRESVRQVRDVASLTKQLKDFSWTRSRHNEKFIISKGPMYHRDVRESIEKCFSQLQEKWKERNPHKTVVVGVSQGYDPSSVATLMEDDPMRFLVESPKRSSLASVPPEILPTVDFRKTSLKYITHHENFLEELDKQGLTDFTIYSSCMSSSGEDEDDEGNASEDLLSSPSSHPIPPLSDTEQANLLVSLRRRHKKRRRRLAKEAVLQAVSKPKVSKTSASFSKQELMANFENAYEQYMLYTPILSVPGPRSYEGLLNLCSRLIDCNRDALQKVVERLQVVLVDHLSVKKEEKSEFEIFRFFQKKI